MILRTSLATATPLLALLFASCHTSLTHTPLLDGVQQTVPGFPYYLPKQTYTIGVTYELTDCTKDDISVTQTATIVENNLPDKEHRYLIPYGTMASPLKTTTFTASVYSNQTLKSVGATIERPSRTSVACQFRQFALTMSPVLLTSSQIPSPIPSTRRFSD